jgi:DNA-binding NarL/FixJ family response regulator
MDMQTNVFIIDDNEMMRSMLRLAIREAGMAAVGEAGTIQAAQLRCPRTAPDIILLDLGLPDGSGLELLSDLKLQLPKAYIIVVSGHNDQDIVRDAVSRGAMGFILKPFSIGAITDTLVNAGRKLQRARIGA